jgi:predicted trehalose synthase
MSNAVRVFVVSGALALAACAAMQQQQAQPVRSDQGEFKNLKVLPQNITHDELIATMRAFARSLGTRCDGCHVAIPGQQNKFDFPSDAKPEKNVARTMVLMTRNINGNYISKLPHDQHEADEKPAQVSCYTCHRGHMQPESAPPAAAEARPGA